MSEEQKRTVADNKSVIVENIDIGLTLPDMLEQQVITRKQFDFLRDKGQIGKLQQSEELVETFVRRPESAYNKLVNILRGDDQQDVANILYPEPRGYNVTCSLQPKSASPRVSN
jgi:hypothetical protein